MMKVLFVISESQAIAPSPECLPLPTDSRKRLLVVDGQSETAEVLRAIFEPRGLEIDRVKADTNRHTDAEQNANVVVLHEASNSHAASGSGTSDVPRVIIGRMERTRSSRSVSVTDAPSTSERYLAEPFHYGELIQAIEDLLADDSSQQNRAA